MRVFRPVRSSPVAVDAFLRSFPDGRQRFARYYFAVFFFKVVRRLRRTTTNNIRLQCLFQTVLIKNSY